MGFHVIYCGFSGVEWDLMGLNGIYLKIGLIHALDHMKHISLGVFDMNGGWYSYPMRNTVELHGTSFQ
jgi:hypothetical protein